MISRDEVLELLKYSDLYSDDFTSRERETIQLRFPDVGKEHTLKECAKMFGVTPERVRQIQSKAIRKLYHRKRLREDKLC